MMRRVLCPFKGRSGTLTKFYYVPPLLHPGADEGLPKNFGPFLDLCVSSLRRGHANLLCIVPILSGVPKDTEGWGWVAYKVLLLPGFLRAGATGSPPEM